MSTPQECKSVDGITVGLLDAINGILPVLVDRDLTSESVQEALEDLLENSMLQVLLNGKTK